MTPDTLLAPPATTPGLPEAEQFVRRLARMEQLLASVLEAADSGLHEALELPHIGTIAGQLLQLPAEVTDRALFALFQRKPRPSERYSVQHAMACGLLAQLLSAGLGWPEAERRSLVGAALTMNVSITGLHNALAHRDRALTVEQRRALASHPERSAELLRAAGLVDKAWLGAVAQHHAVADTPAALDAPDAATRMAAVLKRLDVFLAKLSPRGHRRGLLPTAAARSVCLDDRGLPDRLGAALLRTVGLYPPGTAVVLATGEAAVVLRRGARPTTPVVAIVIDVHGRQAHPPLIRDTAEAALQVRSSCRIEELALPYPIDLLWRLYKAERPEPQPA